QRLLGNALVALAELRCNLGGAPPRPLQLARPLPHYGPPMLVQQATIPIQINVGTTVTMAGNGGGRGGGPAPPAPGPAELPPGPPPSPGDPQNPPHPRRPRPPPVVMMHMNIQGETPEWAPGPPKGPRNGHRDPEMGTRDPQGPTPEGPPKWAPGPLKGTPEMGTGTPERNPKIGTGTPKGTPEMGTGTPENPPKGPQNGHRDPRNGHRDPQKPPPRGTPQNGALGQTGSAGRGLGGTGGSLVYTGRGGRGLFCISGLATPPLTPPPLSPPPAQGGSSAPPAPPTPNSAPSSAQAPGPAPSSGGPAPAEGGPAPGPGEPLPPEFFTSVLQGVLSSMLGPLGAPPSGPPESIAAFLSRLSGTPGLLEGSPGPDGFFGALLALICQHLSMVDVVLLLHGRCQPLARLQPLLRRCFRQRYLGGRDPTEANVRAATHNLIMGLEGFIRESFAGVRVAEGVDITRTNVEFLREQFNRIALHVLRCQDGSFGPRLLELCNRGLFECLALNLHCLRGGRGALGALISDRIRRLSADVPPSLVGWLTAVVGLRLQAVLEQMPVTPEQVLPYVRHLGEPPEPAPPRQVSETPPQKPQTREGAGSPPPATTAEEALPPPESDSEAWAAAVPPEWVPIIREDAQRQRKAKPQPPLSDAYLSGMPAKRRKLQADLQRRLLADPDFSPGRFPNAHRAFGEPLPHPARDPFPPPPQ
uniref:Uncharacterized protein n=1 Tax=Geospiza parvula TaxID=87175 RepID=A0A8C3QCW2_GEOPR